jgi:hypothetical protein
MVDVSTTRLVCGINNIKVTISFITYAGQVLGVNVATLGVKTVASVVQDPLEAQYGLVLTRMTATMAFGELPAPLGGEYKTSGVLLVPHTLTAGRLTLHILSFSARRPDRQGH